MHSTSASIHCPNPLCQTLNLENQRFCQQCRTPLQKRYLWAVGAAEPLVPGTLLYDRYWVKQDAIVLDTQPALSPMPPERIPGHVQPYLRLSAYSLHVPQVYGIVPVSVAHTEADVLLLEHAPIYEADTSAEATLMPELATAWGHSALRQLNWLWQIAQLWEPLSREGVASTLLTPTLLRVEGSLVRLLELRPDRSPPPTLVELGAVWQQWQSRAQPDLADFFQTLCQQLLAGQIETAEHLVTILDRALTVYGQRQTRQIQLVTRTDQGPTRQRNEDACYPPSGTVLKLLNTADPIPPVVVCDGIGGHEGGNVASSLAIETIQQQLSAVPPGATIDAATLIAQLDQVALAANDAISQRNDQEHRQDRQRMGTTLVMALVHTHELYLTHVGDSRAYRITRTGCHQVTLDDDLASRETRLGYALYRDALQHPGSGSLVQALGMGASSLLHPTVQRFVLDEDCVFLLCSDGLSDHDRVEEYWQTELVPILNGTIDLATAGQRLVDLANTKNGHDNVTIGLVYCQVLPTSGATQAHAATAPLDASLARLPANTLRASSKAVNSTSKTQLVQPQRRNRRSLVVPLGILALWALGGALAYFLIPDVHVWIDSLVSPRPSPSIAVAPVASPVSPPPASVPPPLAVGALVQVNAAAPTNAEAVTSSTIALLAQPSTKSSSPAIARSVPPGSILKLSTRRTRAEDSSNWLQFTVCSVPTAPKSSTPLVQAGETGWIRESAIAPLITAAASSSCSTTPRQTPSPSP